MKFTVVGAGNVGAAIAKTLCADPDVSAVNVIDRNGNALEELTEAVNSSKLRVHRVKIEREMSFLGLIKGADALISALPFKHNAKLAEAALTVGTHYVDLGGDDTTYAQQVRLHARAQEAGRWIVPAAGLAPGMLNILAMHGVESFDSVEKIRIRAAALPKNPVPPLNYQLSFSPIGLVNEYLSDTVILEGGVRKTVPALDGLEPVTFTSRPDLGALEAFHTAGAVTTLADHLEGRVQDLDFKTIRYAGHRDIVKTLFDLGFNSTQIIDVRVNLTFRDLLIRQLRAKLPQGGEDLVLAQVRIHGILKGAPTVRTYEIVQEGLPDKGLNAMMWCTALPAVVTAKLLVSGALPVGGGVSAPEFVVPKERFLADFQALGGVVAIRDNPA